MYNIFYTNINLDFLKEMDKDEVDSLMEKGEVHALLHSKTVDRLCKLSVGHTGKFLIFNDTVDVHLLNGKYFNGYSQPITRYRIKDLKFTSKAIR